MPGVPHEDILGRSKRVMKGNGELDRAEVRADVPARLGHAVDHEGADFVGDRSQALPWHLAKLVEGQFLETGCDRGCFSHGWPPTWLSIRAGRLMLPELA